MPITNGVYVNPNWVNNTSPYINATEMNAISDTLEQVPIANGGTGATTVAGARNNLGLGNTAGAVPIANGGTGATSAASALANLGGASLSGLAGKGSANTPVYFDANGVAQPLSSALPVSLGGTGATTAAAARTSLGAVALSNVTSKGSANTPVYFNSSGVASAISSAIPISLGGTGQARTMSQAGLADISSNSGFYTLTMFYWGKAHWIYFSTESLNSTDTIASIQGAIPSGHRPARAVFDVVAGVTERTSNGSLKNYGLIAITTDGDVIVSPYSKVSTTAYYYGTVFYLSA